MENDENKTRSDNPPLSPENATEDVSTSALKGKNSQRKNKKTKGKKSHWAIKATVITFFMSAFFSFVAEMTETAGNIIVTVLLLLFLIVGSIVFDGIGVAAASCDVAPLTAMASKKIKGSKTAIKLVNNADIVSNVCNDVIGDIFGILSGACTVVIAAKITLDMPTVQGKILTIAISAIVSALIVGGKAALKNYAINKSKELVMMTAKIIAVFVPEDGDRKKKKRKKS
ncbi:MAG: Mg2+ and Co2+ transporter CorB [Eubacteriales bacterium]|nr:Mg2+ and Co2+ transporter CorB [Christensenellaceae bacterium]MDY2751048.1 Mg2+ and Co2+ transporter CorB [Eubacteriales bacterium]MCI7583033.1 Mg2+ and Co2+ transporter CorB [Christensenellaceae bacterium]MDD7091869.1 Mg2+ and Co2+ transporter CorB [Christensenellaceae bacterium]MDD7245427.1 Mg2+ and Co2+ transporter CorB [Christensenellaceae bacterium]